MMDTIGLIGIGLVGTALAENLLKAGFQVIGHDIVPGKVAAFERLGGKPASSPRDVAIRARRVILSLMTPAIIRDVLFGTNGILSASPLPSIIIDTSTNPPEEAERLAADLHARGVIYLESPVSGSSMQIKNMDGVFLLGGDIQSVEECKDIFGALGGKTIHLGKPGQGARAKLAINLVLGLNRAALAEGLVFAEMLGINGRAMLELLKLTPAYSRVVDLKGPKMVASDFTTEGKLAQHRKDVGLMIDVASRAGKSLPFSTLHARLLDGAIAAGEGDMDNSVIINEIRRHVKKKEH